MHIAEIEKIIHLIKHYKIRDYETSCFKILCAKLHY